MNESGEGVCGRALSGFWEFSPNEAVNFHFLSSMRVSDKIFSSSILTREERNVKLRIDFQQQT